MLEEPSGRCCGPALARSPTSSRCRSPAASVAGVCSVIPRAEGAVAWRTRQSFPLSRSKSPAAGFAGLYPIGSHASQSRAARAQKAQALPSHGVLAVALQEPSGRLCGARIRVRAPSSGRGYAAGAQRQASPERLPLGADREPILETSGRRCRRLRLNEHSYEIRSRCRRPAAGIVVGLQVPSGRHCRPRP